MTAKDCDGNTALHLVALSQPGSTELAKALLEAGAHLDAVNKEGKTYKMLLNNKIRFADINPLKYTTLTCLAARVVRRTQPVHNVPKHLQHFVQMH